MNPRIILPIIAAATCALASSAQPAVLTLDQCRELAVKNNASVRIAEGNRQAAREVSREAFTHYFPVVNASWLGYRSNKGALQYTLPSVGQLLPSELAPMIPSELAPYLNQSLGEIELIKKGWSGAVTAVQPVFMGGLIVNGNKLAHVGETVADLQKQGAEQTAALTAEQYYWQIVTLQSKKSTLLSVLSMVDTLERQVDVAVRAGVTLRNDLLKVQLKRNDLRSLMVDIDNGIDLSTKLLAQYIGMDGDSIAIATQDVPAEVPAAPLDIYAQPSAALSATTDYQLLEQNVKATELRRKMAVGENLPQVGVGAGWVYDDIFNQKHNFGAVMLTVNVPISGWWGGSHKIKKARIEEQNARIQKEDLSQMLELKMRNAWDDLTAAHRKMAIAHESIAQATENLRLNENFYRVGASTITDLLDAQTLYRQAQDQYTEAYGAYCLSRAKYLDATGQL